MRKIILFLILTFSGSLSGLVFADTYPATITPVYTSSSLSSTESWSSPQAGCDWWVGQAWGGQVRTCSVSGINFALTINGGGAGGGAFSYAELNSCPAGGTISGSNCINATPCTAPEVRNATTGQCEIALSCNYTPTLTTVGSSQTISWQTENTATNSCTDNSVSCQAPLVANVEHKRCDLLCTDGSTVDPSIGSQCPPPVCVGGQTLNTATNTCDEPVCSSLQVLNPATHTCLDNAVCVGGQTQDTSTLPYSCKEPVCTGLQLLNTATHTCEDPAPAVCTGGQTLNTVTNSCTDPVCPSGYYLNASKVCENTGECPLFTTKTMVGGVLKCVTTPTSTESTTTSTNSPGTSTSTSSTTPSTTPGGSSITTTTTDSSVITTISNTTCLDCAKESTLREVVKNTTGKAGTSIAGTGAAGQWYTATDKTYESVLQDGLTQIQNTPIMSFGRDIFSVSIPGGTCPMWKIPAVMGMNSVDVAVLCGGLAELIWPIVSGVLQFLAVVMAFRIALSAV
ncbi:MAG: hypothetical protein Q7U66_15245 [Methylobacter sp.]|nr:hypothetical protein [Methylobacter sp.]